MRKDKKKKNITDELALNGTATKIEGVRELDDDALEAVVGGGVFTQKYFKHTTYGDVYSLFYNGDEYRVLMSDSDRKKLDTINDFDTAVQFCKAHVCEKVFFKVVNGELVSWL